MKWLSVFALFLALVAAENPKVGLSAFAVLSSLIF